ncbi:MAG: T9SS C-terminal target domain-containing protein [Calditrichaeota bacterium]|nr:MAG: T9SS C-terminal target domain-containing protein [Calditrichota bacterium]
MFTSFASQAGERTDFLVNDDAGTATQNNPRIAVSYDRSFIITWVDSRNGSNDIYIQKYDTTGNRIGNNILINDDTTDSYQYEPAIDVDYDGYFSIVWKDFRNGSYPFDPDVYLQRYDSSLTLSGVNENLTSVGTNAFKETPDISVSQSGLGVVVWADYRNGNWDIFCQLLAANGSLVGSNILVNDDEFSAQQHSPKVSMSNQGWFVVSWYDNRNGDDDIYIQLFDTTGTALFVNTKVNEDLNGKRQAFADVATDGAGNFTVVWVDWRNGTYPENPDIYSKKYNSELDILSEEVNINLDGTFRAQREPAISADRLGNVAIIWADSISKSWDIAGQMIDVDGVVREENFKANTDTDSAQVKPDVALDGKYRYLTWVDRRNGNYDIYAAIQKYNDPSIAVSMSSISFDMLEGGALPSAQELIVDHLGYNPLDFTVTSDVDWLDVSPNSSTTTDTVSVSVTSDTLVKGNHYGNLTFADNTYGDSSVIVPVKLTVYYPSMNLSNDTVTLQVFEGIDKKYRELVLLENESLGSYSWTATETSSEIELSAYSGFDKDSVYVSITPSTLSAGQYVEYIVFESQNADGAPDTLVVEIEVVNNMPYILPVPDSIFIYTDSIVGVTEDITVTNFGIGSLNWEATVSGNFFTINNNSGTDNDFVTVTFDSVAFGRHIGSITFLDSSAFEVETVVPVIVDYYQNSDDIVSVGSAIVEANSSGSVSLTLTSIQSIKRIFCPLRFDTTFLQIDSIMPSLSHPSILNLNSSIDNEYGIFEIDLITNPSDTTIPIGDSHLAEVYFTTKSSIGISTIDSAITDSSSIFLLNPSGEMFAPQIVSGIVDVTIATDISDETELELPKEISLSQNYPNPFNLSTTIEFSLPERSEITLNLFNILGQKIQKLAFGYFPAGTHSVEWDGHISGGDIAPSGIYFYRLESNSSVFVKKMLLLK